MLQRQYRLPAQTKLNHPSSYFTESFILKITLNKLSYSRFGFIIGKRVEKKANKRNKIRRKFRASIEKLQKQVKPGYDMLFILRPNVTQINSSDMDKEVITALKVKTIIE